MISLGRDKSNAVVESADLTLLLTVYRRGTLTKQLKSIMRQSLMPKHIVIFQNGNFRKIHVAKLLKDNRIEMVRNSRNTMFFGRFAYLINAETEWVAVLDDDIIPGTRFVENYMRQAEELGGILGANGRIAFSNPDRDQLYQPPDVGNRLTPMLVDFVGHAWFLRRDLLFDMFSIKPITLRTGEDMHLCFSAKLNSGIPSYVAAQTSLDESCDVSMNKYASSRQASFYKTPIRSRLEVEEYFSGLGLSFIKSNTPPSWDEPDTSLPIK